MRVTVDENLCEANGFCESLAPDVFELGDADVVQIADGPCRRGWKSTCAPRWISARRPRCGLSRTDSPDDGERRNGASEKSGNQTQRRSRSDIAISS